MDSNLGGMTLEEIESSAREQPFPDNAGATPSQRFLLKISALVTIRQQQGDSGGVAVFLQSDALKSDAEGCGGTFHPVIATGNDPIAGKVWLSNAALGAAYALNIDCSDQAIIFEQVKNAGFGALPALVIDWRGIVPAGRFYSRGLADVELVHDVELAYTEVTRDDLKECLDHFHNTSLATPLRSREGHAAAVWTDASKGWPTNRPEERIQSKLIEQLRSRYTKHKIRAEPVNEDGITDLVIYAETNDVSGKKIIVKEWVLELKALTDRTMSGGVIGNAAIKSRIVEGLTQAIAYREKEHANNAALCCYDMRATDEGDAKCFSEIHEEATRETVSLWRWFLHRSSSASRKVDRENRNQLATKGK
jgi:hypothetical protein